MRGWQACKAEGCTYSHLVEHRAAISESSDDIDKTCTILSILVLQPVSDQLNVAFTCLLRTTEVKGESALLRLHWSLHAVCRTVAVHACIAADTVQPMQALLLTLSNLCMHHC